MDVRFPLSLRNVEENHERHFIDRQTCKQRHSAVLPGHQNRVASATSNERGAPI